jgi:hypothetical protein
MARKFEIGRDRYAWGPTEPETRLLISAFHDLQPRLSPDLPWVQEFINHFYTLGSGISFDSLAQFNVHLRRLARPAIGFVETDIDDHGRVEDRALRAQLRVKLRDAYLALDTAGRARWAEEALDRIAALPPPHRTFEEWKAGRDAQDTKGLTPAEHTLRLRAVSAPVASMAPPAPLQSNGHTLPAALLRAMTQLGLARSPEITAKVIASLSPDDALDLAASKKIEDPSIIDALVLRSLEPTA